MHNLSRQYLKNDVRRLRALSQPHQTFDFEEAAIKRIASYASASAIVANT